MILIYNSIWVKIIFYCDIMEQTREANLNGLLYFAQMVSCLQQLIIFVFMSVKTMYCSLCVS